MPTTRRSIFVMELEKLLVHGKITALFQTGVMCAKHYISNATNKKTDFEKLIGLPRFAERKITICFNLLQVCPSVPIFVFTVLLEDVSIDNEYEF